ncbi:unnamed protein product, partial [Porites lobata]
DHDAAVETAVISQSEMVVTSPTTESAPVPEGYGTTPDHIILQPDKTGGLGDIGRYINSEMTTKEVEDTVIALSRGKKYELLTQHFSPPSHYKFPGTYENGCLRSFRYEYFKNRPWLKYSPHLDAAFCVPCALFVSNRSNKQSLVTKPFRKWTRYTSNEMIEVIGKHFIQKKIVEEILEAKYYSILGDEATSHNEEKLSIVIRFVDANKDIREEFLEFKDLERTTGAAVSETLLSTLRSLNIPIEDCRGQGYDVFALEVIAHNMHHDECPEQFYGCWQTKTRTDASGLLKAITDFDFIVTFICAYSCLSHMSGLTVKLQKKTNDIFKAFSMIYDQAVTMAEKVGVAPTAPRIAERQRHRANAPAVDPKEHYRVNVAVPFFDHIISELDDQFSSLTLRVSKLLGLVPSVIQESRVTAQQLTDLVDLYKDDLPSPQLFSSEFQRWKIMVQNGRIAADSCASSLKACDPDDFPNLYMLLKIAATLPVTTCECERSISTMRRLNNYMRCTMGESRLSSLALMHIKYDMPVNLEEIVNLFEGLHPRMMQFASLLYE